MRLLPTSMNALSAPSAQPIARSTPSARNLPERQLEKRCGVQLVARALAAKAVDQPLRAVLGHERAVDHDVLAAGALKADHVAQLSSIT